MLATAATQLPAPPTPDAQAEAERFALAARLLGSLLHDARNPLNALSINIEVLAEKLRLQAGGAIPATQEKNLKAMREQIHRVDGILRLFAPYIAQPSGPGESVDLLDLVQKAAEVLGHESRRARVRLLVEGTAPVAIHSSDVAALRFTVTRALLAGLETQPAGQDLTVVVSKDTKRARVAIQAAAPKGDSPALASIEAFARQLGAAWTASGKEMQLDLPLV